MSKTYIIKNTFIGAKDKEGIKVMELPNKDVLVIVGTYYYLENRYETPEEPKTFKVPYEGGLDKDTLEKALRKFKGGNEC